MAWSWTQHPGTTDRFTSSLVNHVDLLRSFPSMGVPVHGYAGVRRLLHSPLHVYYRVYQDRGVIEILHFWHGSPRHGHRIMPFRASLSCRLGRGGALFSLQ